MAYYGWKPYVPVAKRRAKAATKMQKLAKQGQKIEPVTIVGRKIARSFWGEAWCNHLEQFSDFENRLPRGRTYVRNGSVCHLAIGKGRIDAMVSGSEIYQVSIDIEPLPPRKWDRLRDRCTGKIGSMLELLQGRFSNQVMEIVTDRDQGLFPNPGEISMRCNCPDWADLCKHIAAVIYGVGARLDQQPELLFLLRGVDHQELITADLDLTAATEGSGKRRRLASDDLSDLFGVEIDTASEMSPEAPPEPPPEPPKRPSARKKASQTRTRPVVSPVGEFTPSSATVIRLRIRFAMNKTEFALLVGVSTPTITNWENAGRELRPQRNHLHALRTVAAMTPEQASERLAAKRRHRMPGRKW